MKNVIKRVKSIKLLNVKSFISMKNVIKHVKSVKLLNMNHWIVKSVNNRGNPMVLLLWPTYL